MSQCGPAQGLDIQFIGSVKSEKAPSETIEQQLAVARSTLANAVKSQRAFDVRLNRVCSSLLLAGEQIPTVDQPEYSFLQEAYINAATAQHVACEKVLILQAEVDRLALQFVDFDDWKIAA